MVVQPGTREDQQGTNKKAGNQREKLRKKNQTLGTFYQPLCIMEEMGSQEREHKKEEEERE